MVDGFCNNSRMASLVQRRNDAGGSWSALHSSLFIQSSSQRNLFPFMGKIGREEGLGDDTI